MMAISWWVGIRSMTCSPEFSLVVSVCSRVQTRFEEFWMLSSALNSESFWILFASMPIILFAIDGEWENRCNAVVRGRKATMTLVNATTKAVRGQPLITAISPKNSPGESILRPTSLPFSVTSMT